MFVKSQMTAGKIHHEAQRKRWGGILKNQDVVVVLFTPSPRLPDTAMTVGDGNNSPEESVSHMTRLDGNCRDRMVG